MVVKITSEQAKVFQDNGFSQEEFNSNIDNFRSQGLSDDAISQKINDKLATYQPQDTQQSQQPMQLQGGVSMDVQRPVNENMPYAFAPVGVNVFPESGFSPVKNIAPPEQTRKALDVGLNAGLLFAPELAPLKGVGTIPKIANKAITGAFQGGASNVISSLAKNKNPLEDLGSLGFSSAIGAVVNPVLSGAMKLGGGILKQGVKSYLQTSGIPWQDALQSIKPQSRALESGFGEGSTLTNIANAVRQGKQLIGRKESGIFKSERDRLLKGGVSPEVSAIQQNISRQSSSVNKGEDLQHKDTAYEILSQATGRSKNWLKSQLESSQASSLGNLKRKDYIAGLISNTEDKLLGKETPVWNKYFAGHDLESVHGGTDMAEEALRRIEQKDWRTPEDLASKLFKEQGQAVKEEFNKHSFNAINNLAKGKSLDEGYVNALDYVEKKVPEHLQADIMDIIGKKYDELINPVKKEIKINKNIISPNTLFSNAEKQLKQARLTGDSLSTSDYGGKSKNDLMNIINTFKNQENLSLEDLQFLKTGELDNIINYKAPLGQQLSQGEKQVQNIAKDLRTRVNRTLQFKLGSKYKEINRTSTEIQKILDQPTLKTILNSENVQSSANTLSTVLGQSKDPTLQDLKKLETLFKKYSEVDPLAQNVVENIKDYRAALSMEKQIVTGAAGGLSNYFRNLTAVPLLKSIKAVRSIKGSEQGYNAVKKGIKKMPQLITQISTRDYSQGK
jgi:hypothetical protein